MTLYYTNEHRFKVGWHTRTALLADNAARLSAWAGEEHGIKWMVETDNYVNPGSYSQRGLDGLTTDQGLSEVSPWIANVLSDDMMKELFVVKFGRQRSIKATILTYNQIEIEWQCFQVIATLERFSRDTIKSWGNRGQAEVRITFSDCILNTT